MAKQISTDFDNYNSARRKQLDQAEELKDVIFFKTGNKTAKGGKEVGRFEDVESDKYTSWKTKVQMAKVYMFYQTLKAFIWKNVYANTNSMFDVSGENLESDNESNKQKANLCNIFDKMKFPKTCDKTVKYSLIYGDLIGFNAWKIKKEEVRRKITPTDMLTNFKAIEQAMKGRHYFIEEREIYNNAYSYAVNPANFVFDTAQSDNFDDAPKIYKSYKVPEDIINNKYYEVSDEIAKNLREMAGKSTGTDTKDDDELEDETINGKTIEVLEHWGNLKLKDGTLLRNWHCVVVARKYIVSFEKNPFVINPFTYSAYITDPDTGRGISPLLCTLPLSKLQEDLMNRTCDMQTLAENPPIYAPKGFFNDEEVKLYPGKIIEYGDNLTPDKIKQMEFNVGVFLNDITFLSDIMAETSGIFPNMAGADERGNKTATEISTKAQGQLTRLSMLIDIFNQDYLIPTVEKIAKLEANFKFGEERILTSKGGNKEVITIDDAIRQAEYKYTYADRTATTERSNKADLVVQAIQQFAQYIPLNVMEIFTWYLEQKDVENPERFLQMQEAIPMDIQQMLLQNPEIKQLIDMYVQRKAKMDDNGETPPDNQQNVIPDASIPEAQPME